MIGALYVAAYLVLVALLSAMPLGHIAHRRKDRSR